MAQWINLHWNNSFVNWTRLPLLCEKFGAIRLVLVGLMAGSLVRRSSVDFEIFKIPDCIVNIFTAFNKSIVLL